MSGRTREILYRITTAILLLLTVAGTVLIAMRGVRHVEEDWRYYLSFALALVALILLPVNAFVHEVGHLAFGWLAGMKFSSVRFGRLRVYRMGKHIHARFLRRSEVVGSSEMFPKNANKMRGKTVFYALGGGAFNVLYAAAFLTCFFLVPISPLLFFFQLFVPLNLFEGLMSFYPADTPTGKTDGRLVKDLIKGESSAIVTLRVLTAQGLLHRGTFDQIDEGILFDVPVVREDDPSYPALLQLQYSYLFYCGRDEEGIKKLNRMRDVYEELPEQIQADVACDFVFAFSCIAQDKTCVNTYFPYLKGAEGTLAYLRAMAGVSVQEEEKKDFIEKALGQAEKEPLFGIAEMERAYLARIEKK